MTDIKSNQKEHINNDYPNILNEMAKNDNKLKAFLPFIKKYSFFNAYRSLSNVFRQYLCDVEKNKETRGLYETYLLIDGSLSIHAFLSDWKEKGKSTLSNCFDTMLTGSTHASLEGCRNIDQLIKQMSISENDFLDNDLAILTEYRNAFLRFHCLEKGIDLSDYIDS